MADIIQFRRTDALPIIAPQANINSRDMARDRLARLSIAANRVLIAFAWAIIGMCAIASVYHWSVF